jgi:hypothetical protein
LELRQPRHRRFAAALALHRKASQATSDKDFASVEKKLDVFWTT